MSGASDKEKNAYTKRVILALIILAITFLVFVLNGVWGNLQEKGVIPRRYHPLIVTSGSMLPTIKVSSLSVMKIESIEDVNLGDIITFVNHNGNIVTHRVVEIIQGTNEERALVTRGDANPTEDMELVFEDNFMGKIMITFNFLAPLISKVWTEQGLNIMGLSEQLVLLFIFVLLACLVIKFLGGVKEAFNPGKRIDKITLKMKQLEEQDKDLIKELKSIRGELKVKSLADPNYMAELKRRISIIQEAEKYITKHKTKGGNT